MTTAACWWATTIIPSLLRQTCCGGPAPSGGGSACSSSPAVVWTRTGPSAAAETRLTEAADQWTEYERRLKELAAWCAEYEQLFSQLQLKATLDEKVMSHSSNRFSMELFTSIPNANSIVYSFSTINF